MQSPHFNDGQPLPPLLASPLSDIRMIITEESPTLKPRSKYGPRLLVVETDKEQVLH
ncbi:MAG: hypothetical protein MUW55_00035 [Pantoea vagans]|nr:hypothetical protein [Pantoea vagans]